MPDVGELPPAPRPLGAYVPLVEAGALVFLSGMVPVRDGKPVVQGVVGELDDALVKHALLVAAQNALAVLEERYGSFDGLRLVQLHVKFRTTPGFTEHPALADAASTYFDRAFGQPHTRLISGVASLPKGLPVALELILERR